MPRHTKEERKKNKGFAAAEAIINKPKVPNIQTGQVRGQKFSPGAFRTSTSTTESTEEFNERTGSNIPPTQLIGEGGAPVKDLTFVPSEKQLGGLTQLAEEQNVFGTATQDLIIPPELENLSVVGRIAESIIPGLKELKFLNDLTSLQASVEKGETISQAEITMIEDDLIRGVQIETSSQIDTRLEDTEKIILENGIPIIGVVGAAVIGSAVGSPVSEFVGTDGQIKSLELALSQYNEMITIPSRGVTSGSLSPTAAFEHYNEMERSIISLEQQLQISSLTSTKVALALRGRGIEGRLLKLKKKLQEGRRIVFAQVAKETFQEVDIARSVAFTRSLQDE